MPTGGPGAGAGRGANTPIGAGAGTGAAKKQGNKNVTLSESGKEVTMTKAYYNKKMQDLTANKSKLEESAALNANYKEELKQAQAALTLSLKQKNEVAEKNTALRIQNAKVLQQLKDLAAKTKTKSTKLEQMDDVKREITFQMKDTFRSIKFAQAGQELVTATERVWKGVKARLKLDQPPHSLVSEEFLRIYAPVVQTELSLCRQYVQSRSQEAAHGKYYFGPLTLNHGNLTPYFGLSCPVFYKAHGENLPQLDDLLNVYDIPELPEEPVKPAKPDEQDEVSEEEWSQYNEERNAYKAALEEYKDLKNKIKCKEIILTWCLDDWLPAVVGVDWWHQKNRCYLLPTDKYQVHKKTKVCVTKTSEAFGLLQFENSRARWLETFKWKKANPHLKRAPQYSTKKPETHIFKSKWSDDSFGKGSGWNKEAYKVFMKRVKHVGDFRAVEVRRGSPRMRFGRSLVKRAHGIAQNETSAPSGRRRVLGDDEGEAAEPVDVALIFDDDGDDDDDE